MTLEGKTPAERAGLNVTKGQNTWLSLLEEAMKGNSQITYVLYS